jgi:hypothetical protein
MSTDTITEAMWSRNTQAGQIRVPKTAIATGSELGASER